MKRTTRKTILSILLTLLIGFSVLSPVLAQSQTAEQTISETSTSFSKLYEEVNPSVVYISVAIQGGSSNTQQFQGLPDDLEELLPFLKQYYGPQDQDNQDQESEPNQNITYGSGTGFVWDTEGHIVTNNHVIEDATDITITYYDGIERKATVIGADPDSDLAVLSVEDYRKDIAPVKMGDSDTVKTGEYVAAIGNPFGNVGTITMGIVSALGRNFPIDDGSTGSGGHYTIPDMIQTDAAINPGNSGGILINLNGEVIGVVNSFVSATYSSAGIGYAIPSNLAVRVIPKLISDGKYEHAWIGISGIALNPDINAKLELDRDQRGALVETVQSGSPADKAGIKAGDETTTINGAEITIGGDIITKINDREVKSMDDIISYLAFHTEVGDKITLHILRDGKEQDIELTLAARPSVEERTGVKANEKTIKEQVGEAWIGTYVKDITNNDIKKLDLPEGTTGALITQVTKDSPADDANLQENDIIQKIDDTEIKSVDDLKSELSKYMPGERVTLTILRDGETKEVRLTLGTTKNK
ncbi:MAG TPA: PDZ domain-containing protein [Flexilinea sp.]|nr:PDZ domain-containing protein [Flexilinea sp.]